MNRFAWLDRYMTGVHALDDDHRRLVDLARALGDGMNNSAPTTRVRDDFEALLEFAKTHFATEEQHMVLRAYPGLDTHRTLHTWLIRRMEESRGRLYMQAPSAKDDLLQFVEEWLFNHMLSADRQYATFLNAADQLTRPH